LRSTDIFGCRLLKENTDIPDLHLYSGRLFTSIQKFVVAASRMQLRKRANKRAVKMAVQLVKRKLEFLRRVQPVSTISAPNTTGKLAFTKWLIDNYGSQFFAREETIKRYRKQNNPCGEVSDSTLRKWIEDVSNHDKHNKWSIRKEILNKFSGS